MAVVTFWTDEVKPSDVFGNNAQTALNGYERESFTITVPAGKTVRVGTLLKLDYTAKTATIAAVPADAAAVTALGDVGVFVGRDLPVNPAVAADFSRLTLKSTGKGVAVVKGDGSAAIYKGYLETDGTLFYDLPAAVQAALAAKLTKENRFKVLDQVKPTL